LHNNVEKLFLVYALGLSGTRKYRKEFIRLIQCNTDLCSKTQIGSFLEKYKVSSDSSATYFHHDFNHTYISVVLETVFDDRIHLTEKTLRPIAVGHPFIIANGPGSLEYLRSYGFQTFSPFIDESYDCIKDHSERMNAIVAEMQRINNLNYKDKMRLIDNCRSIAQSNKKIFFSDNFFKTIIDELRNNVFDAFNSYKDNLFDYKHMLARLEEKNKCSKNSHDKKDYVKTIEICNSSLIKHLSKGGTLENYVPPNLD